MHTLDPDILARLEAAYGRPQVHHLEWPVTLPELETVRASTRGWRFHDVTLFIFDGAGRVALIRKPQYPPGVWRNPGGGVAPGEDFAAGARREALEETGLEVELERYLLRVHVTFVGPAGAGEGAPGAPAAPGASAAPGALSGSCAPAAGAPGTPIPWVTHVFTARATGGSLVPRDTREIAAAGWFTLADLTGPIAAAIQRSGRRLLAYRAWLHATAAAALGAAPAGAAQPLHP